MVRSVGAEWDTAGYDRDLLGQLATPGHERGHGRSRTQTTAMRGGATPVEAARPGDPPSQSSIVPPLPLSSRPRYIAASIKHNLARLTLSNGTELAPISEQSGRK